MVERPAPLAETQKGLVGDATMPQGFTRQGSTWSARPGRSETRLCCSYLFAARQQPAHAKAIPNRVTFCIEFSFFLLRAIGLRPTDYLLPNLATQRRALSDIE